MIRQVLVAVLISVTAAQVQATWPWWAPSPWTVAITVGEWITKKDREVYYLQVRALGRDEEDARQQAFRLAVNQAIGTLVVAETEARNGEVIRNEIISHSSGYVDDFRVLTRRKTDQGLEIVIDVWVTKSVIADRILNRSQDRGRVEGGRIGQQIDSFDHSRGTGDQVLATVLRDYPGRSFDVTVGTTKVAVDTYRAKFLMVPVQIAWNPTYLASLAEAIRSTTHVPQCDTWSQRESSACRSRVRLILGDVTTGFYDDRSVGEIIDRNLGHDRARILLKIKDTSGRDRYRACWVLPAIDGVTWHARPLLSVSGQLTQIYDRRTAQTEIAVPLQGLPVRDLDRVTAEIVRERACPR